MCTMMLTISTKAAAACNRLAQRSETMPKKLLKYSRQMTMPLSSSTSMLRISTQNSTFCPAL